MDMVYEESIDAYLLRTNQAGIKQIRRLRQAKLEADVRVQKQEEIIWSLDRDVNKCYEVKASQSSEITSLRKAVKKYIDKEDNCQEQIAVHIDNATAYKKQARLWKGVSIGGVTLVLVGAGTIAYIFIAN